MEGGTNEVTCTKSRITHLRVCSFCGAPLCIVWLMILFSRLNILGFPLDKRSFLSRLTAIREKQTAYFGRPQAKVGFYKSMLSGHKTQ